LKDSAVLLVQCPDRRGLDAAIAGFINEHGGNILRFEQHQTGAAERFYLARIEWDLNGFTLDFENFPDFFEPISQQFSMKWQLARSDYRPRVVVFVSRQDHCLVDLLYRQRIGELACDIVAIISNHSDSRADASFYGIPYHVISVNRENKTESEREQIELLRHYHADLVVLARYMQILSPDFIKFYPQRIINIHHSFLPAFIGAKPHLQAYSRGVKLIGATAHYVTEVLDDGPIIEQGVERVSHKDGLEDLVGKGRDLERVVLSRAVRWHIENRILLHENKTVIFE
jgi:formyltetrahydrofolate deformylase